MRDAWYETVKHLPCPVILKLTGKRVPVGRAPHHIFGKMGWLLCAIEYFLPVSEEGHAWIEANKDIARREGWLAPKGQWLNPPKKAEP